LASGLDFVRIGLSATQNPLDEIARFLVGQDDDGTPRPCEIVDVGGRKDLDVSVISPVDNLLEAHFDAIWGSVYDRLLRLIQGHETTLVFANSRYKTERTALRLSELSGNGDINIGSHHGSMSKRVRLSVENRLKRGDLDALVSTSTLICIQRDAAYRSLRTPAGCNKQRAAAGRRSRRSGGIDRTGARDS